MIRGCWPGSRCTAATCSRGRCRGCARWCSAYLDALTEPGPGRAGRRGAEPRPGRRVLRRRVHRRADDLVPDLPLPAVATARRGLGCGRAHRLRPGDAARPGRQRRPAGRRAGGLDRRPADAGHACLQHRRHARPADRGLVPLDAAPGPQPQRPRPACRSRSSSIRDSRRRCRRCRTAPPPRATAAAAGTARTCDAFTGTYGDYLLGKVSKVFPQLRRMPWASPSRLPPVAVGRRAGR